MSTMQPKFRHHAILNALAEMQQSPAYAVRKSVLAEAEIGLAAADIEIDRLRAQRDELARLCEMALSRSAIVHPEFADAIRAALARVGT